jgi:hypothetical protein
MPYWRPISAKSSRGIRAAVASIKGVALPSDCLCLDYIYRDGRRNTHNLAACAGEETLWAANGTKSTCTV